MGGNENWENSQSRAVNIDFNFITCHYKQGVAKFGLVLSAETGVPKGFIYNRAKILPECWKQKHRNDKSAKKQRLAQLSLFHSLKMF